MAKYAGSVGFEVYTETAPGVKSPHVEEHSYTGDTMRDWRSSRQNGDGVNDNITVSNEISILADPFAYSNYASILYATYLGVKWKVKSVEVQFPRLILELGDVYDGSV